MLVFHNEDGVEPGENGGHEVYVLLSLGVVPSAKDAVCSRQDGTPAVKGSGDASFGNGDGLLLHGLMDRHPVVLAHLVELIDAHHPTIGQNHGASLKDKGATGRISHHTCSQTRS